MHNHLLQLSGVVADLLYDVDQVPAAGEEAMVTGFGIAPGGGFNAMVAAKRAGLQVSYGGSIGTGPFADVVRKGLEEEDIPVLRNPDQARDQGCCTVLIDRDGERTFVASDGAEGHIAEGALEQIDFAAFNWMLLSGYSLHYKGSREVLRAWLESTQSISNLIFDPAPIVGAIPQDVLNAALARATWVSANAHEAAFLTGKSDPAEAAVALAAQCPAQGGALVRNGASGCVLATQGACHEIPTLTVCAVDTNGAGDAHIGSFIARLAQGDDPVRAAEYANAAAALSTTLKGPACAPAPGAVIDALRH